MDSIFAAQRAAEWSQWRGLYRWDKLVDFPRAWRLLKQYEAALSDAELPAVPVPSSYPGNTGYYSFYDYQRMCGANFPLFYKSPDFNLEQYVRIGCMAGKQGCANSPSGGRFETEFALLQMEVLHPNATIYYTLDGSEPTTQSAQYNAPIAISTATRVRAVAAFGESPLSVKSDVYFNQTRDSIDPSLAFV